MRLRKQFTRENIRSGIESNEVLRLFSDTDLSVRQRQQEVRDMQPDEGVLAFDAQDLTEYAADIMDDVHGNPDQAIFVKTVMRAWDAGSLTTAQAVDYVIKPGREN